MPAPVSIPELAVGARVQDTFLLIEVSERTTSAGDPFWVLTFSNHSGSIPSEPFWLERKSEIEGLRRGHAVQVIGEIASYRGKKQLKVTSIRPLPKESVDLSALLPSVGAIDGYWKTLDGWRGEIKKPRLKATLDLFYDDPDFRKRYEQCPAAIHGHHAALGGLLKHTTEVAAIARTIARACGADLDVVLAGVLLHDIGKLESYRWDGVFEFTDVGRLLGHVVIGALMLDRRLDEEDDVPCTPFERDILLHMILSHHGHLEFGSPVVPMTLEAEVIHWADNASAKTASFAEALAEAGNFSEGEFSGSIWALDRRRIYRGTSDWGAGNGA